jgi:hypothetical protein
MTKDLLQKKSFGQKTRTKQRPDPFELRTHLKLGEFVPNLFP